MFIAIIHVLSPGNASMFSMICEIFSYVLYPIYGFLALKRRPIGFEDTPFKTLTNALLVFN